MTKPYTRQVFELRYLPLFRFFDCRSKLLEELYRDPKTKKNNFEHWQLGADRVHLFDADQKRAFFVTFSNCGFTCENPATEGFSKDQIMKYMTLTSEVIGENIEEIQRVGFRQIRVVPVEDLQDTKRLLKEVFIRTDSQFFRELESPIVDFTLLPLVFKHGDHSFQITLGPATKQELEQRLGSISDLPETSLYFDVDYFSLKPNFTRGLRLGISDFLNHSHETLGKITEQLMSMKII